MRHQHQGTKAMCLLEVACLLAPGLFTFRKDQMRRSKHPTKLAEPVQYSAGRRPW